MGPLPPWLEWQQKWYVVLVKGTGSGRTVTDFSGRILCTWTALGMNCGFYAEEATNLLQS